MPLGCTDGKITLNEVITKINEQELPVTTNDGLVLEGSEDGTVAYTKVVKEHNILTDYVIDDVVVRLGSAYKALTNHSASAWVDNNWTTLNEPIGSGTQFNYKWSTTISGDPSSGRLV